MSKRLYIPCLLVPALLLLPGCTHPSEDNIRLRKINQDLNTKVTTLTTSKPMTPKQRTIDGLDKRNPTISMLPPEELKKFWPWLNGLGFGRLSGGVNVDAKARATRLFAFYVSPTDEFGTRIQAAGSLVVEAFDLRRNPADTRLGRWEWDAVTAKSQWRSFLFGIWLRVKLSLAKVAQSVRILQFCVTFTDELTHIPFTAQTVVHANIPPAPETAPTTAVSR